MPEKPFTTIAVLVLGSFLLVGIALLYNWVDCSERGLDAQFTLLWLGEEFSHSWQTTLDERHEQVGNTEYFETAYFSHQALREDYQYLEVPACAKSTHVALLRYMDAAIEADRLLAQGADSQEVEAALDEAVRLHDIFLEEAHAVYSETR
jgi:hypothetical protein